MVFHPSKALVAPLAPALILSSALFSSSCSNSHDSKQIEPVYDKTGRLQLLKYDANKNGTPDTFSYMDGARVVRIEIDKDEDGKIDRWEYYDGNQKLTKVGFSRSNDGKEDAWTFAGPDGTTERIELSTHGDGKVTRTEFYENNALVRAEEDTDEDGVVDKWEAYDGERLVSVAFDTMHRGRPDRRLLYGPGGTSTLEVADANGRWAPPDPRSSRTPDTK